MTFAVWLGKPDSKSYPQTHFRKTDRNSSQDSLIMSEGPSRFQIKSSTHRFVRVLYCAQWRKGKENNSMHFLKRVDKYRTTCSLPSGVQQEIEELPIAPNHLTECGNKGSNGQVNWTAYVSAGARLVMWERRVNTCSWWMRTPYKTKSITMRV